MKLVGVAVIENEEDIVEAFVRHSLHFLDRLYVHVGIETDATRSILDRMAAEGLALTVSGRPEGADAIDAAFRMAAEAEGAGAYLLLGADDFILPLDIGSREELRTRLAAIEGSAAIEVFRLCLLASPAGEVGYGSDVLKLFRYMEHPDEVRRVASAGARRLAVKLAGPGDLAGISVSEAGGGLIARGLAAAPALPLFYAHVPVRSAGQLVRKVLGTLTAHVARGGTIDTLPAPMDRLLNTVLAKDVGRDELLPASTAFGSTTDIPSVQLLQGDLSPLFHYDRRHDGLLSGPIGALGLQIAAAMEQMRGEAPAADRPDGRAALEARLRLHAGSADMERYFALVEETGATDVPPDILAKANSLSEPVRMPVTLLDDGTLVLPYLEMDISYACNLRCDGCSHYSNFALPGVVRLDDARAWMNDWKTRLRPRQFRMLGGEPAINPDAAKIVRAAAEAFPESLRSLVSNGLLLHKRTDILEALAETGTGLDISLHSRDAQDRATVDAAARHALALGVKCSVHEAIPDNFTHLYQGSGKDILPFDDGAPFASWACCDEKNCACIHQGLLWKCPPLAFLGLLDKKIGLRPEWERYLAHRGKPSTASGAELYAYLAYPEQDCAMCPAKRL